MATISVVGPQDGEHLNLGTTTMRILEDGRTTEQRFGLAVSTLAPHTDGPPQHLHTRHDEGFYVVSGTAEFGSGDDVYSASAGTLVMVPPGVPHRFSNPGEDPLVMVSTFTPAFYVTYFRELAGRYAEGRAVTPESMADIMARYTTEPAPGSTEGH